MVNLSNDAIKAFVRTELTCWKNVIQRECYTIFKDVDFKGLKVNILSFNNRKFIAEEITNKIHYIEFGQYLISVKEVVMGKEIHLDFTSAVIYNAKSGNIVDENFCIVGGNTCINNIIVLNHNILVVCNKYVPRFYAVVNEKLQRIPTLTVEHLLSLSALTEKEKSAITTFIPGSHLSMQNGLIIDTDTLSTISELDYNCWKSRKRTPCSIYKKFPTSILLKMLSLKNCDKPVIRYIQTDK
jgi:hypothetical protein